MPKTTKPSSKPSAKPKEGTITIGDKDQKILWARAAGRCSMPDCRKLLTMNTKQKSSVTLGQMCHIIGEKEDAARGKSEMSLADRNSYSNLVLMCGYCHTKIDRDEKTYTVEILHKIKDDHEIWVDETLSTRSVLAEELVYSSLIDTIAVSLQLDQWNWFIDNAVRQLVHQDFIFAADVLSERLMAIDFPGKKIELEQAMKGVMEAYLEYVGQYLSANVVLDRHGFYRYERIHRKDYRSPDFWREGEENEFWARENFLLLCKYVLKLNDFVKAVRDYSNPKFHIVRGKFLVVDSFGIHLGEWGAMWYPQIEVIEKGLKSLEKEKLLFKKGSTRK